MIPWLPLVCISAPDLVLLSGIPAIFLAEALCWLHTLQMHPPTLCLPSTVFPTPFKSWDVAQLSSLYKTLGLIPSSECGGAQYGGSPLKQRYMKGRGKKIIKVRLSLAT